MSSMRYSMEIGVKNTIAECDKCISSNNSVEAERLQQFIIDTYEHLIPKLYNSLSNYNGSMYEDNDVDWIGDIKSLKKKLEFFLTTGGGFSNLNKNLDNKGITVNSTNEIHDSGNSTNSNTNNNTINNLIDIKAELSKVREKIEADEILDDESKEEINEKLNEIESVLDENPNNNEKWKKLKGVINWVTTKGYKIGEMVLPILTSAMFPDQQQ